MAHTSPHEGPPANGQHSRSGRKARFRIFRGECAPPSARVCMRRPLREGDFRTTDDLATLAWGAHPHAYVSRWMSISLAGERRNWELAADNAAEHRPEGDPRPERLTFLHARSRPGEIADTEDVAWCLGPEAAPCWRLKSAQDDARSGSRRCCIHAYLCASRTFPVSTSPRY